MNYAERIADLEQQLRDTPDSDKALPPHAMTLAQHIAYYRKEWREHAERCALGGRDRQAQMWMESNFTSLTHYRRYVAALEQTMLTFCREEQRGPHYGVSSFMRELVEEEPALFAEVRKIMDEEAIKGWSGVDPLPLPRWRSWLPWRWIRGRHL